MIVLVYLDFVLVFMYLRDLFLKWELKLKKDIQLTIIFLVPLILGIQLFLLCYAIV